MSFKIIYIKLKLKTCHLKSLQCIPSSTHSPSLSSRPDLERRLGYIIHVSDGLSCHQQPCLSLNHGSHATHDQSVHNLGPEGRAVAPRWPLSPAVPTGPGSTQLTSKRHSMYSMYTYIQPAALPCRRLIWMNWIC